MNEIINMANDSDCGYDFKEGVFIKHGLKTERGFVLIAPLFKNLKT